MNTFTHYDAYTNQLDNEKLREAIGDTVAEFNDEFLKNFDWFGYKQCLMYGDVQSGKTSHVIGVIAHALDEGFPNVLFLTSDNTRLADQTFERVYRAFPNAEVCSREDDKRFRQSQAANEYDPNRKKPTLVVLTKNVTILRRWRDTLASTKALSGAPLLIVDDEADNASLNAKVNQGQYSPVNKVLTSIREQATSCIYVQVTGTPQAILLQAQINGWKPDSYISFKPGDGYIGGKQLFEEIPNPHLRVMGSTSYSEDLEFRRAILNYLLTSAVLRAQGQMNVNMLIHPSRKTADHDLAKSMVVSTISDIKRNLDADEVRDEIAKVWSEDLAPISGVELDPNEIHEALRNFLDSEELNYTLINSNNEIVDEEGIGDGFNIVIGGDSLGRGLTIPKLQTVYYSRTSKTPQADTLWQHARMFGYDRKLEYLRVFMPGEVAKSFHEVHKGNEALKTQLDLGTSLDDITIDLASAVRPTRKSVIDSSYFATIAGGVNYFAAKPSVKDMEQLDNMLQEFGYSPDPEYISIRLLEPLLEQFETEPEDFPVEAYRAIIKGEVERNNLANFALIVRRGRKIRQGTGSLLSQGDRELGDSITNCPVLTLYRIEEALGWSQNPIWVPNIKFPNNKFYCRVTG